MNVEYLTSYKTKVLALKMFSPGDIKYFQSYFSFAKLWETTLKEPDEYFHDRTQDMSNLDSL